MTDAKDCAADARTVVRMARTVDLGATEEHYAVRFADEAFSTMCLMNAPRRMKTTELSRPLSLRSDGGRLVDSEQPSPEVSGGVEIFKLEERGCGSTNNGEGNALCFVHNEIVFG